MTFTCGAAVLEVRLVRRSLCCAPSRVTITVLSRVTYVILSLMFFSMFSKLCFVTLELRT